MSFAKRLVAGAPARLRPLLGLGTILFALAACSGSEPEPPTLRSLLARGTAHAEIEQWAEALDLFQQAVQLAPQEPTARFDLAVAHFRSGNSAAALAEIDSTQAPPHLAARIELLRGKIAYENGDTAEELAAHREAQRLVPQEAAYVHALAQLQLRAGASDDYGVLVQEAHRLWPDNAFLAVELVLWALAQPDEDVRQGGFTVLESLVAPGSNDIALYLEKGRAEMATAPGVPASLRIAVNLLRATKRFQSNSVELQSRLEIVPLANPVPTPKQVSPYLVDSLPIRFETAALAPVPELAAQQTWRAVAIVDDADGSTTGRREAGVALASDGGLFYLAPDARSALRLTETRGIRQLLTGDLDDDEQMEILLLGTAGVELWDRDEASEWTPSPLPELATAGLHRAVLVDFEHDGDLDVLALDGAGQILLITHRGEAGLGAPAPILIDDKVMRLTASDLDADADQDLILATATELLVLRNWRQGEFSLQCRAPIPRGEKARQLLSLDYDADGHMDIVALTERGPAFWRGDGQANLARDDAASSDTAFFSERLRPKHLATADLDLDGDFDLWVSGVATNLHGVGLVALINHGGRFQARADLLSEPWPSALGSLILDLDGDRDPDVLSWGEAGLMRTFRSHGAENHGWLALRLTASPNKVPRDARGVRLEVVAGDTAQWLEPKRPNIILGLGDRSRAALIKATWPNGISEYLFEPEGRSEHTLELSMRVEGSCPFLYASDGESLRFVTDILGLSPVGMLAARGSAVSGPYVPADPEEYLRLPNWVAPRDGTLELAITEELREALYLDQAELVAVDAPRDVQVYNGEQWLPRAIDGLDLRLLTPWMPPASVRDDRGREVLDEVRRRDDVYLRNHSGQRYQGAVPPHQLTVELPPAVAAEERPALILVGWLHWGNTSTNVARSQDPEGAPVFPFLEVPDAQGGWRRVATEAGLPAGKTKPVVIDLTGIVDPGDPRVRLTTDFEVYWDLIATANLQPAGETPHRVHRLAPQSAELGWRGFSRWFRPAADGPYLFDYADSRDVPWRIDSAGREITLAWQELEGYYTAYGSVVDLLSAADDQLAVIASGEEIKLSFDVTALPPLPDGWQRTFFFHSEGWEKDGDPNVSCSRTVEPLPFRGMTHDPCSGRIQSPSSGAPRTRWVSRDRLQRRAAALRQQDQLPGRSSSR